jgi:hypothetical protein
MVGDYISLNEATCQNSYNGLPIANYVLLWSPTGDFNGRKLFKVLFFSDHERAEIEAFKQSLKYLDELPKEARPCYFLEDETSNRAYNTGDEKIKILYKNGQVKEISQVQDTLISAGLLLPIKKHYICYLRQ